MPYRQRQLQEKTEIYLRVIVVSEAFCKGIMVDFELGNLKVKAEYSKTRCSTQDKCMLNYHFIYQYLHQCSDMP